VSGKASCLAMIFVMAASVARAEPATPEGAKQMLDGYVAVFGKEIAEKGIVTVDPHGDAYKVTWHIRRALEAAPSPTSKFQIGDFAYDITPGPGGAWRMTADAFPPIAFDTPTDTGRMSGRVGLTGVNTDNTYDPAQPVPFTSRSMIGDVLADLRILEAGKVIPLRIEESGVEVDLKQTKADVGANLALHETLGTIIERMSVPVETQQSAKLDMTFTVGATTVDGTVDRFRTEQAVAAWRFFLAHKDEPKNEASVAAVKTILAAGLPGWQKMNLTTELSDLAFDMSLAKAHMKALRETLDLPGFTEIATGGFGLKIDEFNMHSPFLPQGFESLLPLSLNFDIGVKLAGLDQIAKIALADPEFLLGSGVSDDGQAKIQQIFKNSDPTFTLAPGYLRLPLIDIAYQGEVKVSPGNFLTGHIVVSADTLDKVIEFVRPFVIFSPDVAKAVLAIDAAKGMAKAGPNGRLNWNIQMSGPPRQLTVNGVPIPIDK
jgi:hypothetical protein